KSLLLRLNAIFFAKYSMLTPKKITPPLTHERCVQWRVVSGCSCKVGWLGLRQQFRAPRLRLFFAGRAGSFIPTGMIHRARVVRAAAAARPKQPRGVGAFRQYRLVFVWRSWQGTPFRHPFSKTIFPCLVFDGRCVLSDANFEIIPPIGSRQPTTASPIIGKGL